MIHRITKSIPLLSFLLITSLYPVQTLCTYCHKKIDRQYILFKNKHYHNSCFEMHIQLKCELCREKIEGEYTVFENKNFHPDCYEKFVQLRCDHCGNTISDAYNIEGDKNYHQSCYRNNILQKCNVCVKPIEGKYIEDFWGNVYHKYHSNTMPACENCNRIICQKITQGGYSVNKNRYICALCYPKVVVDQKQIEMSTKDVKSAIRNIGIKGLPSDIPISLVNSMAELDHISTIRLGDVKGYTHYDVETLDGRKIKETYHIYILSSLHELTFKAVLAHEFLHVYLFQNDHELRSDLREGFCNLGSQLIYLQENSDLSKFSLKSMYESDDPDYGKGFIKMNSMLEKKGWVRLLKDLKRL